MTPIHPTPPGTSRITLGITSTPCRRCRRPTTEYATVGLVEANSATICLDCWIAWGQRAQAVLQEAFVAFIALPAEQEQADETRGQDDGPAAAPAP